MDTRTLLLGAGIAGTALFVVTSLLDGMTRPGYDAVRHPVSALALGSRGWIQTTNFVVTGLLVTAAAVGIHDATDSLWLGGLVAAFGIALVASGVFPMDAMRGYPPGAPEGTPSTTTRRHDLHDNAGAVVFTSLPAAAVAGALTLDGVPWVAYSVVTAVAFAVLAGAFATAWEADAPRTGLLQRLAIVTGWTWLGLICWHLLP